MRRALGYYSGHSRYYLPQLSSLAAFIIIQAASLISTSSLASSAAYSAQPVCGCARPSMSSLRSDVAACPRLCAFLDEVFNNAASLIHVARRDESAESGLRASSGPPAFLRGCSCINPLQDGPTTTSARAGTSIVSAQL